MAYGSVKIDSITTSTKTVAVDNLSVNGYINNAGIAIDAAIAFSKLQNVSAADKILGRGSSGSGAIEEITCTAAGRALLDDADATAQRATLGLGSLATSSSISNSDVASNAAISGSKIQQASVSNSGAVQLNDTVNSTSITQAATANSVKTAYDLAQTAKNTADSAIATSVSLGLTVALS